MLLKVVLMIMMMTEVQKPPPALNFRNYLTFEFGGHTSNFKYKSTLCTDNFFTVCTVDFKRKSNNFQ